MFGAYWLVAGPVGFYVLKRRGYGQHAWVAFAASGVLFTGLAWGGATILRPGAVEATHLTLLDHVYGQPVQRARMWASVLVPRYGTASIKVGEDPRGGSAISGSNRIAAWDEPESTGGVAFPDARAYFFDANSIDTLTVPVRQTIKQIQADWVGGPTWKMPIPVADAGTEEEAVAAIKLIGDGKWTKDQPMLTGVLRHGLPGTLRDIMVVVVTGQAEVRRQSESTRAMGEPYLAFAFSHPTWPAGETLDLSIVTSKAQIPNFRAYVRRLRPQLGQFDMGSSAKDFPAQRVDQLTALAFFNQLEPPELNKEDLGARYAAQRWSTHGWDLGRWFTQPCVIIVGHLAPLAESPVPLFLDGEPIKSRGRTVVRWVYPLPASPPPLATNNVEAVEPEAPAEGEPPRRPTEVPGTGVRLVEPGAPETRGGGR